MAWVALLLLPVALMTFAVQLLIVREVWRSRHERPGFRDLRRREQLAVVGSVASGFALAALISAGYGQVGAKVLLIVVATIAFVIVALVPFMIWAERRGSSDLHRRLFGPGRATGPRARQ